ncbi:MAG TPA: hypothetical protein VGM90_29260 [Kofleriaceae bacterium]
MRAVLLLVVVAATASVAAARPHDEPAVPVAIEIVIQGHEIAMGNDAIEEEDSPSRYPGMLYGLKKTIDEMPLATWLPAFSKVGVITYADRSAIRWPMSNVAMFSGDLLGAQKDYYTLIGTNLESGVELGLAELSAVHADRKFLVVIGDGNDTNPDAAKQTFPALRDHAEKAGIEPIAIVYRNALSDPNNQIGYIDHAATTVSTAESIVPAMRERLRAALQKPLISQLPTIVETPSKASWYLRWRWQLAIGSVLALFAMGGVWFVRRERM